MPFKSSKQMRAAFGGYLGPEMKGKALTWAHETPNIKGLPEHVKKTALKNVLKKHIGKGGAIPNQFVRDSSPINLLETGGEPPTTPPIPKSQNNTMGKGGPTQNNIQNIERTRTRGNDLLPKEAPQAGFPSAMTGKAVQVQMKAKLPYSSGITTAGPASLDKVITPSMRIPARANLGKELKSISRGGWIPTQTKILLGQIPKQSSPTRQLKKDVLKKVIRLNK
jgi:hypothetical protein